jgi:hypothetical protein
MEIDGIHAKPGGSELNRRSIMARAGLVGAAVCALLWGAPALGATKFLQAEDATVFNGARETSASSSYTGASYVNPARSSSCSSS